MESQTRFLSTPVVALHSATTASGRSAVIDESSRSRATEAACYVSPAPRPSQSCARPKPASDPRSSSGLPHKDYPNRQCKFCGTREWTHSTSSPNLPRQHHQCDIATTGKKSLNLSSSIFLTAAKFFVSVVASPENTCTQKRQPLIATTPAKSIQQVRHLTPLANFMLSIF